LPEATRNLFGITSLKLKALALGIDKIEASASGGKLRFGPDNQVDPLRIVHLVQKQAARYSLAGANELRFRQETETPEQRMAAVERILDMLQSGEQAA